MLVVAQNRVELPGGAPKKRAHGGLLVRWFLLVPSAQSHLATCGAQIGQRGGRGAATAGRAAVPLEPAASARVSRLDILVLELGCMAEHLELPAIERVVREVDHARSRVTDHVTDCIAGQGLKVLPGVAGDAVADG